MSDFLAAEGIRTLRGLSAPSTSTTRIDLVVVGNAISRGNAELEAVLDRKIRHVSLPEAMRDAVPVAGAVDRHRRHARQDDDHVAGRVAADARRAWIRRCSSAASRGTSARADRAIASAQPTAPFVIEGDEYDSAFFDKTAKFLKYLPDIAVINNIEFDHADIYPDLDAVRLAFRRLVNLVPRRGLMLLGADSPDAAALAPRRAQPRADIRHRRGLRLARDGDRARARRAHAFGCGEQSVTAACSTCRWPACTTSRNALAAHRRRAVSAASDLDAARAGPGAFLGVKRRLEVVGTQRGVVVYDDFAHHPTAVAETLAALRAAQPASPNLGRLRAALGLVVPPHLSGRLRAARSRAPTGGDRVGVPLERCPAASACRKISSFGDLSAAGVAARHLPDVDAIVRRSPPRRAHGDLVVDHVQRRIRRHSRQAARGARMKVSLSGDTMMLLELEQRRSIRSSTRAPSSSPARLRADWAGRCATWCRRTARSAFTSIRC